MQDKGLRTERFDFFGVRVKVSGPPAADRVLDECTRFWAWYRSSDAPEAAADLTIALESPADWSACAALQERKGQIHIGPLEWFYEDDGYVMHEPHAVIRGNGSRIEAAIRPEGYPDPRVFVHFTLNLAFIESLRHHGLYYVHGACLQSPAGKNYLIAGDGCQGKSTLTLSLLMHGYRYLSDDAVFIDARTSPSRLLGYHKHFHVGNDLLPRFDGRVEMSAFLPYGKTDKSEINPEVLFPGQRLEAIEKADVILSPGIIHEPETRISPMSSADLLTSFFVASTQVFFDRTLATKHLAALREVAGAARGYRFEAGRDVYENPELYHTKIKEL